MFGLPHRQVYITSCIFTWAFFLLNRSWGRGRVESLYRFHVPTIRSRGHQLATIGKASLQRNSPHQAGHSYGRFHLDKNVRKFTFFSQINLFISSSSIRPLP